jgi:hypothetical protein
MSVVTLVYGTETWVKRIKGFIFLRSDKDCTRLEKIKKEDIQK